MSAKPVQVAEGREASLAPSPPAVPVHLVEEHVLNRKQDQGFLRFWGEFMGVHLWFCKPARPKLHRTEPVPDLEVQFLRPTHPYREGVKLHQL